jgi:predicted secreted Zn-dependent protease
MWGAAVASFRKVGPWVALVACAVLGLPAAHADDAEFVYYDLSGNSAKELRHQMNSMGPYGDDGKRADGRADWRVSWTTRYARSPVGCKFTEVETTVTGKIILPRWSAGENASSFLVKKWQNYMAALRLHEDGHYGHGIEAAEEIRALRESLGTAADCESLVKQFDAQVESILEKYRRADITYDAATKHGFTQGAVFP